MPGNVGIDKTDLEWLENAVDRIGDRALPIATQRTLNDAAFETRKTGVAIAKHIFTMRNKDAERSIQVTKAFPSRNIGRQQSEVGSVREYMAEQEEGFTKQSTGKHGIPVPTPGAAGQPGAHHRTKAIRRQNLLGNIRVARGLAGAYRNSYTNRRQRMVRMAQDAVELGHRVIFIKRMNGKKLQGFYRVIGGRRTKRGWPEGAKLQFIYQIKDKSITTEPHPWLAPATKMVSERVLRQRYIHHLNAQLERVR